MAFVPSDCLQIMIEIFHTSALLVSEEIICLLLQYGV